MERRLFRYKQKPQKTAAATDGLTRFLGDEALKLRRALSGQQSLGCREMHSVNIAIGMFSIVFASATYAANPFLDGAERVCRLSKRGNCKTE